MEQKEFRMGVKITFGTDGWRGLIADDFTFENVAAVARATAEYFRRQKKIRNGIVIGYDSRFLSREFAEITARVLGTANLKVRLGSGITSTPAVSLAVKKLNAAGGIVITASHNPAQYNGFKIKGDFGGPAFPEQVEKVEARLGPILKKKSSIFEHALPLETLIKKKKVVMHDFQKLYVDDIKSKIDCNLIISSNIRILYDAMHGAGQGVMERIIPGISTLRQEFNPSFGGANPEPLPQNMESLMAAMKSGDYDIGIATDGDADRIGAVDEKGTFVDSHRMFCILLKYFVEEKKMTGEVAKSFSVTQMVDAMCLKYGLRLHETQVGFKYLCRLMIERDILIAGEESGGIGVKGHLPERDGTYVGLLLCEIMAKRKKKLSELVQELFDEFGGHYFNRVDSHLTPKEKDRIMAIYKKGVQSIAGYPVRARQDKDGYKFFIDGGWVLVRASGTEPLIRFYAEADVPAKVDELLAAVTEPK